MTYYDYAEEVLDQDNFRHFSKFIEDIFYAPRSSRIIYFYGRGGNGKTTLLNKLHQYYSTLFGYDEKHNPRCLMVEQDVQRARDYVTDPEHSAIVCVNEIPSSAGPDTAVDVVYFYKTYHPRPRYNSV